MKLQVGGLTAFEIQFMTQFKWQIPKLFINNSSRRRNRESKRWYSNIIVLLRHSEISPVARNVTTGAKQNPPMLLRSPQ